jgi:hypothetical protein
MRPERALLALALAVVPAGLAAQSIELRYRPSASAPWVRTVAETAVTTTVFGLPSLPDSTAIESTWRTVESARVLDASTDLFRVRVEVDSARARARIAPNPRADVPTPGADNLVAELVLGPMMELRGFALAGRITDSAFATGLTARFAGFEFVFPPAPITPGSGWSSAFRYPLGPLLNSGGRLTTAHTVRGVAAITLDSMTVRGRDTLAFLRVDAPLQPTSGWIAGEGGMGPVTFRGRLAAKMVWSTSWNAVLVAATNGRIEASFHLDRPEGAPVDGRAVLLISGRHQVRP